jgi:hypothetical protein
MTTKLLTETSTLVEASGSKSGRLNVQIITPGWGSSGYYSDTVLEQAATDKVFPAGTRMFLDHPTATEDAERPGRSVKDLAAVLLEDAVWNGGALVAPVRTFGPYREAVAEMADAIGVSIRSTAEVSEGEADGRRGLIVERLVEGKSVDFVTAAGRGGRILEVLESARAEVATRAVTRGVAEATANETREMLAQALTEKYGGEKIWIWVRDFDDDNVWYEHETSDSCGTFQLAYSLGDTGPAELTGDPVEVRATTTYKPIEAADEADTAPAVTAESKSPTGEPTTLPGLEAVAEGTAADNPDSTTTDAATGDPGTATPAATTADQNPTTSQEEAMTENPHGSPRQVIEAQIAAQARELVEMKAREKARGVIAEDLSDSFLSPLQLHRVSEELMVGLPIVNDELDVTALRDRIAAKRDAAEAEAGEVLQAHGAGLPRGLGTASHAPLSEAAAGAVNFEKRATDAFQTLGLSESAAQIAAKGR